MIVLVETVGASEFIDLDTNEGMDNFVMSVVQDDVAADALIERIASEDVVVWNEGEPEFYTRFTKQGA